MRSAASVSATGFSAALGTIGRKSRLSASSSDVQPRLSPRPADGA